MATTDATIKAGFRLIMRDSEASYDIDAGDAAETVRGWANNAIARINRMAPFIEAEGFLEPDASAYSFDLTSVLQDSDQAALTNFLKLRFNSILSSSGRRITRHPRGLAYIRDLQSCGGLIAGTPTNNAVKNATVIFNAIMAAPADSENPTVAELISVDYWAKPTDLAASGDTPAYPLDSGFDDLIYTFMRGTAGPQIGGEVGDKMTKYFEDHHEAEIDKFRDDVRSAGLLDESGGIQYSDLGDDPAPNSTVNDYTETNPWG